MLYKLFLLLILLDFQLISCQNLRVGKKNKRNNPGAISDKKSNSLTINYPLQVFTSINNREFVFDWRKKATYSSELVQKSESKRTWTLDSNGQVCFLLSFIVLYTL